jgi:hypothetical protein
MAERERTWCEVVAQDALARRPVGAPTVVREPVKLALELSAQADRSSELANRFEPVERLVVEND